MESGQIVIHPEEAEAVRYLFREYNQGKSFLVLAKAMQEWSIPYDGDKPWNKNMIARILADGIHKPVLIDQLERLVTGQNDRVIVTTARDHIRK